MNEKIIRGAKEFIDDRGKIANYELPEAINWIGYIESKAKTVRANHYHPVQEQKVLLVSGRFISASKRLPDGELETVIVNPGDLVVTPPNIAHTMIFLEDSVFLNLVAGEREQENYGKHTIPYELIAPELKEELLAHHTRQCHNCGNQNIKPIISLGETPLANNLLDSPDEESEIYPLQMNYCPDCYFCQLSHFVPPEKMFSNYLYFSSTAKTFRDHFVNLAQELKDEYNPELVIDIGSNDGVFLKPLQEKDIKVLGIEPAHNLAKSANEEGLTTINAFMEDLDITSVPKADIITAFNVFAHTKATKTITEKVFQILKPGGLFIIEVQYLLDTIRDLTFDNIYHEHLFYYSITSLNNFFNSLDKQIVKVKHVDTHGGSIRVYIKRKKDAHEIDDSVQEFIQKETGIIDEFKTFEDFANRVKNEKLKALKKITSLKGTTIGYGAPAKATTILNYFGIKLPYTIEDNIAKQGKYIPGVKTKIISKDQVDSIPNNIIVLAWNFLEHIKEKNSDWVSKGVNFITLK